MQIGLLAPTVVILLGLLEIDARGFTDVLAPLTAREPLVRNCHVRNFRGRMFIPEAHR